MRFVDNKDYPEPDNNAYYDIPANRSKGCKTREFDDREMIRCPVKPQKWWNMKTVDMDTCEVENIDPQDYPDFCDAYISYAEYTDGTPLNDDELEKLQEESGDWINQYCLEWGI